MPDIAKHVRIVRTNSPDEPTYKGWIFVGGEEFPFYTKCGVEKDEPFMAVTGDPEREEEVPGLRLLTIRILAEDIEYLGVAK